jgi:hypothetical protein
MSTSPTFASTDGFLHRTRFVLVNDRVPRAEAYCALCFRKIEKGYVRESQTRMLYATQCFVQSPSRSYLNLRTKSPSASLALPQFPDAVFHYLSRGFGHRRAIRPVFCCTATLAARSLPRCIPTEKRLGTSPRWWESAPRAELPAFTGTQVPGSTRWHRPVCCDSDTIFLPCNSDP